MRQAGAPCPVHRDFDARHVPRSFRISSAGASFRLAFSLLMISSSSGCRVGEATELDHIEPQKPCRGHRDEIEALRGSPVINAPSPKNCPA